MSVRLIVVCGAVSLWATVAAQEPQAILRLQPSSEVVAAGGGWVCDVVCTQPVEGWCIDVTGLPGAFVVRRAAWRATIHWLVPRDATGYAVAQVALRHADGQMLERRGLVLVLAPGIAGDG
jgi:hypothetical protein